jgi:CheY-like chemotaxis protein
VAFTVLVVDGDPSVLRLLHFLLRSVGYGYIEARDGVEALDLAMAAAEPVDMVLVEQALSGISAADVVAGVRCRWPHAQARYMVESLGLEKSPDLSHAEILPKPLTAGLVLQAIKDAESRRDS